MSIYSKEKVVSELETFFDVKLNPLPEKEHPRRLNFSFMYK